MTARVRALSNQLSRALETIFSDSSIACYKEMHQYDIESELSKDEKDRRVEKDRSIYIRNMMISELHAEIKHILTTGFLEKALVIHGIRTGVDSDWELKECRHQYIGYLDSPFSHKTRNDFVQDIQLDTYLRGFLKEVIYEKSKKEQKIDEIYAEALNLNESFKAMLITNDKKIDEHHERIGRIRSDTKDFVKRKLESQA